MGRCSILERVHQETELGLRTFRRETENVENLGLQPAVVDSDTAASYLDAIAYHVVGIGTHLFGMRIEQGNVFGFR